MTMNRWSRRQAQEHIDEAFAVWKERNKLRWIGTDLAWLIDTLGIDASL
jgi:hypothetical protein